MVWTLPLLCRRDIKMSAPWGVDPSDAFHVSTGSHGSMLAGKKGNTHVVPRNAK